MYSQASWGRTRVAAAGTVLLKSLLGIRAPVAPIHALVSGSIATATTADTTRLHLPHQHFFGAHAIVEALFAARPASSAADAGGAAVEGSLWPEVLRSSLATRLLAMAEPPTASSTTSTSTSTIEGTPAPATLRVLIVHETAPCALAAELRLAYEGVMQAVCDCAPSSDTVHWQSLAFNPETFLADVEHFFPSAVKSEPSESSSPPIARSPLPVEVGVVILIQNGAFQNAMRTYRLRLELFRRGLRVAEHCHLALMQSDQEVHAYFASCCLDPFVAEAEGRALSSALAAATTPLASLRSGQLASDEGDARVVTGDVVVVSEGGHELCFSGGLEPALLNTGFYRGAVPADDPLATAQGGSTIGGTFPIGEVITESVDIGAVDGVAPIFAFPNTRKAVVCAAPGDEVLVHIRRGVITHLSGRDTARVRELEELVELIAAAEGGSVHVRELGVGLNPHIGRTALLTDMTSFERQRGVHISIGKRHPLFIKKRRSDVVWEGPLGRGEDSAVPAVHEQLGPVLRRKDGTFHVDLFIAAERIMARPKPLFAGLLEERCIIDFVS